MRKLKLKNSRLCCRYFTYNRTPDLRFFFCTDTSGISEPRACVRSIQLSWWAVKKKLPKSASHLMNSYWAGRRTKIFSKVKTLVPWECGKQICWQVYAKHVEGAQSFLEMLQNLKNRWKHFVDDVFIKDCEFWRSDPSNKEIAMLCRD